MVDRSLLECTQCFLTALGLDHVLERKNRLAAILEADTIKEIFAGNFCKDSVDGVVIALVF